MGQDYPVVAIPAPVWAHFGDLLPAGGWQPHSGSRSFEFSGNIIDSSVLGLSADGLVQHLTRPPRRSVTCPVTDQPGPWRLSRNLFRSWIAALRHDRRPRVAAGASGEQPPPSQAGLQPQENCRLELHGVVYRRIT